MFNQNVCLCALPCEFTHFQKENYITHFLVANETQRFNYFDPNKIA